MKQKTINMIASIAHVRSLTEFIFNAFATTVAFIFGYFKIIAVDNVNLFMAVLIVVVGDWIFGVLLAIKKNAGKQEKL